jgi:hypothetical protein
MSNSAGRAIGKIMSYSVRATKLWLVLTVLVVSAFAAAGLLRSIAHGYSAMTVVHYLLAGFAVLGLLTTVAAYFGLHIVVTRDELIGLTLKSSVCAALMLAYYLVVPWETFAPASPLANLLYGGFALLWVLANYIFFVPALLLAARVRG